MGRVRRDSGSYDVPTAMDLILQQKDNFVRKISNLKPTPLETVKFTDLKKEK